MIEPQLTVRELAASEETLWDSFAARAMGSTFFHQARWRQILTEKLGKRSFYRCAWRNGLLVGILPLTEIRSRLFGNSLISPGFGICGGIVAADHDVRQALATDAAHLGQSLGVDYVELRHEQSQDIGWLTPDPRFFVFRRKLAATTDENMKAIPRKKRADLRKALANSGLRVEHGQDFDAFFHLYSISLRNLGTPILPRSYYSAVMSTFGSQVEISIVHGPKYPVAAVMSFHWKDCVYPYYGGALPEARALHAYDLLYWSVMCKAVELGMKTFDFGRSRAGSSAFDYKSFWGFSPTPLCYQYHLGASGSLPHNSPDNPKFRLFIEGWKRFPLPFANAMGPLLARQLG